MKTNQNAGNTKKTTKRSCAFETLESRVLMSATPCDPVAEIDPVVAGGELIGSAVLADAPIDVSASRDSEQIALGSPVVDAAFLDCNEELFREFDDPALDNDAVLAALCNGSSTANANASYLDDDALFSNAVLETAAVRSQNMSGYALKLSISTSYYHLSSVAFQSSGKCKITFKDGKSETVGYSCSNNTLTLTSNRQFLGYSSLSGKGYYYREKYVVQLPNIARNARGTASIQRFEVGNGVQGVASSTTASYSLSGNGSATSKMLATPSIKSATKTSNSITIKFNSVTGASGYVAYYRGSQINGAWSSKTLSSSAQSFTLSGLSANSMYHFKLVARGNGSSSADSYESSVYTAYTSKAPTIAKTKLKTPSICSISNVTQNNATVKWNYVSGAYQYMITCTNASTGRSENLYVNQPNSTGAITKTLTGLSAGTKYSIKITALASSQSLYLNSTASSAKTFTTAQKLITLSAPRATVTQSGKTLKVSWNGVSRANGYTITWTRYDRLTGKTTTGSRTASSSARAFSLSGISAYSTYTFSVKANGDGRTTASSAPYTCDPYFVWMVR